MLFNSRLTFRGITRSLFKRLRKKAADRGIRVISPAGEAVKDGVTIQWKYDPEAELLEVDCVRIPFWIDAARVKSKLSEEIRAALETRNAA